MELSHKSELYIEKNIQEVCNKPLVTENTDPVLVQEADNNETVTLNFNTEKSERVGNEKTTLKIAQTFYKQEPYPICKNEIFSKETITLIKKKAKTNVTTTSYETSGVNKKTKNIVDEVYRRLRETEKYTQTDTDVAESFKEDLFKDCILTHVLERKPETVHKSMNTFKDKVLNVFVEAKILQPVEDAGTSAISMIAKTAKPMAGNSGMCEKFNEDFIIEQELTKPQENTKDEVATEGNVRLAKDTDMYAGVQSDRAAPAHYDTNVEDQAGEKTLTDFDSDNHLGAEVQLHSEDHTDTDTQDFNSDTETSPAHTELDSKASSDTESDSEAHTGAEVRTDSDAEAHKDQDSDNYTESEGEASFENSTDSDDDKSASTSPEDFEAQSPHQTKEEKNPTLITFFQQYIINPLYQGYKSIYLRDEIEDEGPVAESITLKTVAFPPESQTHKDIKNTSIWSTMRDHLTFPVVSHSEDQGTLLQPQPQAGSSQCYEVIKEGDMLKPMVHSELTSLPNAPDLNSDTIYPPDLKPKPLSSELSSYPPMSPATEAVPIIDIKQKSSMWGSLREYFNFPVSKKHMNLKAGTSREQDPKTRSMGVFPTSIGYRKAQTNYQYRQVISYNAATALSSSKPSKSKTKGSSRKLLKYQSAKEKDHLDVIRKGNKVDVGVQIGEKPGTDSYTDRTMSPSAKEEENVNKNLTGFFEDTERRADYVLVFNRGQDKPEVEAIKLAFLTGLVKAGIHLEAEDGVIYKNLLFVKLYASDLFLRTYAKPFGVYRPFRDSHEAFINPYKWLNWLPGFSYTHQLEWIRNIRAGYKKPLRMSTYDRSYVVRMLLLYQRFGEYENYYGLDRLLNKKIILDAYALHDGPYQQKCSRSSSETNDFNARQILYTNWSGLINLFWGQPLYVIFEYFGPQVGFYFAFYELYNKFLIISTIWGIFMMVTYQYKYGEYFEYIKNYSCAAPNMTDYLVSNNMDKKDVNSHRFHDGQCAECEGENETWLCPYTRIGDNCLDLKILRYIDSPYMILYSSGICFLALLFLTFWQRIEYYWAWIVEETDKYSISKYTVRTNYVKPKGILWRLYSWICAFFRFVAFDLILPICAILIPIIIILFVYIGGYKSTRPLSAKKQFLVNKDKPKESNTAEIDKPMEHAVYITLTMLTQILLYGIEKLLHFVSYFVTKIEHHATQESFRESLVNCYTWISFHYTFGTTIFFTWIKGVFHNSIVKEWDMVFNISLPWVKTSYNMTKVWETHPEMTQLLRIFFTLNCGYFSCLRQGVVVYVTVLIFRVLIVGIILLLLRPIRTFIYQYIYQFISSVKKCCRDDVPTAEREYSLEAVSEEQITSDFNHLFLQFALIILFAPLFPLAPLLALLLNIWDIRNRAHSYVVHYRRVVLHKAAGIGAWNDVFKMICYAMPVFHGITVARTEIFQRYMFNKVYDRPYIHFLVSDTPGVIEENSKKYNLKTKFLRFLIQGNIRIMPHYFKKPHARIFDINKARWSVEADRTAPVPYFTAHGNNVYYLFRVCRLNGYYSNYVPKDDNFYSLGDEYCGTSPTPEYYEWQFYKVLYNILFTLFFSLVAVCLRCYYSIPEDVDRILLRERQLLRLRTLKLGLDPGSPAR